MDLYKTNSIGHVNNQSYFLIIISLSTNQLAVLLTECWTVDSLVEQPLRFRLSVVYASLGITNITEDNSNVNMSYWYVLVSQLGQLDTEGQHQLFSRLKRVLLCFGCHDSHDYNLTKTWNTLLNIRLHTKDMLTLVFSIWFVTYVCCIWSEGSPANDGSSLCRFPRWPVDVTVSMSASAAHSAVFIGWCDSSVPCGETAEGNSVSCIIW